MEGGKWVHDFDREVDRMKVLIACEFSGIVRNAFIAKGHEAVSCDLLPTERIGPHIQGDVLEILNNGWDMMIAHPPCTYLCNSGARWLYNKDGSINKERWFKMEAATMFFGYLLSAQIPQIAVENPIMHKHARRRIGVEYDQIIQPWQFGHGETKATCLWLKGLRELGTTKLVAGRKPRIHHMSPSKNRGHLRSVTLRGIANAMAEQWGLTE